MHPEAYWYFFKMLAFGSTNPDEHPRLASATMEIAMEYSGSFLAAYIIGELQRDNFNAQFWCSALRHLRAHVQSQLLLFGDHPNNLSRKDQPVHYARKCHASREIRGFRMEVPAATLLQLHDMLHHGSARACGVQEEAQLRPALDVG
ncbi:hypothetical protein E2562_022704 [Oryza meyeriana var. granulata]|uniref:Uncharacterized protein n=1 Tax=Oryza meyeriana var. granulata TaxID=110450 RepID=A0A6G1DZY9_9ORYZ|nr:hypothetical protein E2562_022704 [Oryza meyeriana var. granulata]